MAGTRVDHQPFEITAVDDAVLRAVSQFPFLTAEQLVKLRYSGGSLTYARDRLRRLFDAGYLQRCHAPSHTPRGKAPFAYRLARKGFLYCEAQGLEITAIPHRAKDTDISYPALCHATAVNEVLIAATLLVRRVDGIRLDDLQHEQQIKRKGQTVATGKKEGDSTRDELEYVLPDGWLDVRIRSVEGKALRAPLWLEVDRNTEGVKAFKKKIRGILAYYDKGHYKRLFGSRFVTVVVIVDSTAFGTEGDATKRVKDVARWIAEELHTAGRIDDCELFAVGTLPHPSEIDPAVLFLRPVFVQPSTGLPISLLDLPASGSQYQDSGMSTPLVQ